MSGVSNRWVGQDDGTHRTSLSLVSHAEINLCSPCYIRSLYNFGLTSHNIFDLSANSMCPL